MNDEQIKKLQQNLYAMAAANEAVFRAMCSPKETLEEIMRSKPTSEVEGFYYWGSRRGKEIAKAELKRRGIDKRNFFQKLFNL